VYKTGSNAWQSAPAVGRDGTIYYVTTGLTSAILHAVSPSGVQKWQTTFEGKTDSSPTLARDGSILVTDDGALISVGHAGDVQWRVQGPSRYATATAQKFDGSGGGVDGYQGSAAVTPSGRIYVAGGGVLSAIDASGDVKWSTPIECLSEAAGPTVGADGTAYVVSGGGSTVAAYGANGELKWSIGLGSASFGNTPVVIGTNRTLYVAGQRALVAITQRGATVSNKRFVSVTLPRWDA